MTQNAALLASHYARRPLLLEPNAARDLLQHIRAQDPRGLVREGRFEAALRRIGIGRGRPAAMDQEDEGEEVAPTRPAAYTPLWAQQAYGEPTDEGFAWALFDGIACMEVSTAISDRGEYFCGTWFHGYDTILAGMREALSDSRVKGLFVHMSSPGGVVADGLYVLAAFMRGARAEAGGKPIHVHADMACSAAYWISSQADRITAGRVGLVGSIGAVLVHEDYSGALEKAGIVVTPIQFGAEKTAGAGWAPLSASAKADLQAEIDQCGRDFVADVVAGRPKLSAETLLATEARVFMAEHADPARSGLKIGFVDAIASEEQAFADLLALVSGPSGRSTPKEGPQMANPKRKGPSAVAEAPAEPAAAAPDEGYVDCETCNGSGLMADGTACADCDGEGQVPDPSGDPDEMPDDDDQAQSNAAAIAASDEAKSHPHLALAAIQSGQSLPQLQATIAALASAPKTSRIDAFAPHAARLGPDAQKPAPASAALDTNAIYGARAATAAKR